MQSQSRRKSPTQQRRWSKGSAHCYATASQQRREPAAEISYDILAAEATSVTDINKLMEELLFAREYLQSEAERVRQMNARYAQLAQTASASVRIISETLGKWRNSETDGPAWRGTQPHGHHVSILF